MDLKSSTVRVNLSPAAGFCIKSKTLQSAVCKVSSQSQSATELDGTPSPASLTSLPGTLSIAKGTKVFVNIAWDSNVPPPPEGNEEAVQKAMRGEEELDESVEQGWFVPVVVSEPRTDIDKSGNPSVVFDCVYNSTLKSRCLRDQTFRAFLVELGLQRIEAQHSLVLSRQLGTPNIASKGKLLSRSTLVPLVLFPEAHPLRTEAKGKKLIEEVGSQPVSDSSAKPAKVAAVASPKSILKTSAPLIQEIQSPALQEVSQKSATNAEQKGRPRFEWAKDGEWIKVTVHVPKLTYESIQAATLDVEPRRIILEIPPLYTLDMDVSLPDAHLVSIFGGSSSEGSALMLKRQRDFDVEGAKAEWRVADGVVIIDV